MNNKTSDKNVANIEDDVDELKSIMNLRTVSGFAYSQKNTLSLQKAIKNVLADYTRQKEMNEEHQKINGELREKVQELEKNSNCDSVYATSDKNVATEEDLEVLNEVLLHNRETEQVRIAIEHILAEREQKDKQIQELEEENAMLKKASNIAKNVNIDDVTQVINKSYEDFVKNYIPKQVIIDAINENRFEVYTREYGNVEVVSIDVLQELLEGGN